MVQILSTYHVIRIPACDPANVVALLLLAPYRSLFLQVRAGYLEWTGTDGVMHEDLNIHVIYCDADSSPDDAHVRSVGPVLVRVGC